MILLNLRTWNENVMFVVCTCLMLFSFLFAPFSFAPNLSCSCSDHELCASFGVIKREKKTRSNEREEWRSNGNTLNHMSHCAITYFNSHRLRERKKVEEKKTNSHWKLKSNIQWVRRRTTHYNIIRWCMNGYRGHCSHWCSLFASIYIFIFYFYCSLWI